MCKEPPPFAAKWISDNKIDDMCADFLKSKSLEIQGAVMDLGDISGARNPSAVVVSRIRQFEQEVQGRGRGSDRDRSRSRSAPVHAIGAKAAAPVRDRDRSRTRSAPVHAIGAKAAAPVRAIAKAAAPVRAIGAIAKATPVRAKVRAIGAIGAIAPVRAIGAIRSL